MSIKLIDVNFIYQPNTAFEHKALIDINLTIDDGEFIGIIGHTGSGKSTLIQLLNGLLKPTAGKIIIDNEEITAKNINLSHIRKKVGLVFQYPEYQLFEETVYKDVIYGPKNLGLTQDQIHQNALDAISLTGLDFTEIKDKSPFDLSGGQKRRVAIAGVLAMKPSILILDEPSAGLDPAGKRDILDKIENFHKQHKQTTILVSHSMEDVARYVDKIIVLNKGQVAYFDAPSAVFSHAEALVEMGLDIPDTVKIVAELRARGINLSSDIFTEDALVKELTKALGGKDV